jgi:hypothetical protein
MRITFQLSVKRDGSAALMLQELIVVGPISKIDEDEYCCFVHSPSLLATRENPAKVHGHDPIQALFLASKMLNTLMHDFEQIVDGEISWKLLDE